MMRVLFLCLATLLIEFSQFGCVYLMYYSCVDGHLDLKSTVAQSDHGARLIFTSLDTKKTIYSQI